MKQKSADLIEDLIERTRLVLNQAQDLLGHDPGLLNRHPAPGKWSALECIEHLNRYGNFYLPEISRRIKESNQPPRPVFSSGILGNYFAKSMLPKERLNAMKTFKVMDPAGSDLDASTLEKFISQQHTMLDLLNRVRKVDLTKTKTSISISSLIKLRMGDTLRVVIYHNQRHLVQALRALEPFGVRVEKELTLLML